MGKPVSIIIVTHNREKEVDLCVESIFNSDYDKYEVIVVDNASIDNTIKILEEKYKSKIKLIRSNKNLMAGGGRNLGAKYAKGEYLLFVDSDNIVDKEMVAELVKGIKFLSNAGIVGPLMYYFKDPKRIWWAGANINLWTSKTKYVGIGEIDKGQYNKIKEVGHIPNVFMTRKTIWDKIGGIDKDYVMHYEESDFAEKVKRLGYKLYRVPGAETLHNIPFHTSGGIRNYGGESPERIYYTARNRILFMRKNANLLQYLLFLFVFLPLFTIFYLAKILGLRHEKYEMVKSYLKGTYIGIAI